MMLPDWRGGRCWLVLSWCLLWALGGIGGSQAAEVFKVTEAKVRRDGERVLLNARIDFRLGDMALEALDNGVPLTIEVHIQLRRAGAWIWEKNLVDQRLRYVIRYRPLSQQYMVTRLPGSGGRVYATRDAAIAALGELDRLDLIEASRLAPGESYLVHIAAFLDLEELPLPLRPLAYLLPAWKHSSGWTSWPVEF